MNTRPLLLAVALFGLIACDGDPVVGADAGPAVINDAGVMLEMSELFESCEADEQCPGVGAICRTATDGYPGGYCTVPCEDRTPCDSFGVYHHCVTRAGADQAYCERRCLNGLDCGRNGYTCQGEVPPSGGLCIGVCSSDEDCGGTAVCDTYSATCGTSVNEVGAITGEPCTDSDSCRSGQCVPEVGESGDTGWIGGYCIANCILPVGYNNSDFFAGDALPNGGCAGDAVCLPVDFAVTAQRDLGRCYRQCTSVSDCRTGYRCLQEFSLQSGGSSTYTNGICLPDN